MIEGSLKFPGYQLHAILEQSLDKTSSGVEYAPIDSEPGADTLRFPSGIPSIQNTAGGYYGISIILGSTGVGKSMAAIASACDAALAGWRVIYFNAEIAKRAFYRRVARRIGHTDEARHELQSRFKHYLAGPGITLEEMRLSILDQIRHTDDKLLIILDSVNTIAELMADEGAWSYFDALKRIGFWALESRRESEGKISWILTSETNKQQEVKGQKLAYLADYILRLEKGDTDDHVRIFCEKGREGGGGTLGPHLREWRTGEFLGEGDRPGDRGGEEEPVF